MLLEIMVLELGIGLLAAAKILTAGQRPPIQPDPLGTVKLDPLTHQPSLNSDLHKQLDKPLTLGQLSLDHMSIDYYGNRIRRFQVTGVDTPPPKSLSIAKSIAQKSNGDPAQVIANDSIMVRDGYSAITINIAIAFLDKIGGIAGGAGLEVVVGGLAWHFSNSGSF